MGFESIISGYITTKTNQTTDRDDLLSSIQKRINELPLLTDDKWPFLPREIFSITITEPDSNPIPISYKSIVIHFGMSVKELEHELETWLSKFETFMKSIPGVWESLVTIQLTPYTITADYGHLAYWWRKELLPQSSDTIWQYKGGPLTWDELTKNKN